MRTDDELLTLMREHLKDISRLEAGLIKVMAEYQQNNRDDEFAPAEVACALGWAEVKAGTRLDMAVDLVERLPQVVAALEQGRIEMSHVLRYVAHTTGLSPEHASLVADRTLPRAEMQTTGQLNRSLAYHAKRVDPKGCAERKTEAAKRRYVSVTAQPDEMADLTIYLPAPDATAIYQHIDYLARKVKTSDDERSMDEIRVDVFR